VSKNAQKIGLGRILVNELEKIGRTWHMKKIMLTVIKINAGALLFYEKTSFVMDPISPGYVDTASDKGDGGSEDDEWVDEDEECDYMILSKRL